MTSALRRLSLCALLAALLPTAVDARATETQAECFDALVVARLTDQIPTALRECDDCVVISWPWILQLHVQEVVKGRAPIGPITVLRVQHTSLRTGRSDRWWLRRNALGVFNVLRLDTPNTAPPRCAPGTPPTTPYIQPAEGKTLEDLRREGEQLYGRKATR